MKSPECDNIRDLLPEWVVGALEEDQMTRVEKHLSECPECGVEEEVVRTLFEARPQAPAGLEARIQLRLREEMAVVRETSSKERRVIPLFGGMRWAPSWALSAAALVVLSLGIGVMWEGEVPEVTLDPMEVAAEEPLPEAWLWDDGMVAGAPVYDGLTDEQLEALIQELEG